MFIVKPPWRARPEDMGLRKVPCEITFRSVVTFVYIEPSDTTVTLRFPSNIPGLPGHNWLNSIAMATPIAHKGAVAGAKVVAMTLVDLFTDPSIVADAKKYFQEEQASKMEYKPMIRDEDTPAIDLNRKIMATYRSEMKKYYYTVTMT